MNEAFKRKDAVYIAHAFGVVARAKRMTRIAGETGLAPEQLYRFFNKNGNPGLREFLAESCALRRSGTD